MFPGLIVGIKKTGLSKSRSAEENVCFTAKTANVTHQILFCQGTSWLKISYSETCLKSFRPQKSWNELNYTFSEPNNCYHHTHTLTNLIRQTVLDYIFRTPLPYRKKSGLFFFFWQQSVPNFATSVHPEHLLRVVTTCIILEGLSLSSSVLLAPQHDPVPKTHTAGGGWYLKCAPTPASLVLKNALKSQAWWYTPAISVNGQERKPEVQGPQQLVTAWPSEIVWNKQTNTQIKKGNKTKPPNLLELASV